MNRSMELFSLIHSKWANREGTGVFDVFPENNERAEKQKKATIEVVVGNPPYSTGQKSQNDDNQNLKYDRLDKGIADTYALLSKATLKTVFTILMPGFP